jgi:hypothetical protein
MFRGMCVRGNGRPAGVDAAALINGRVIVPGWESAGP